MYKSLFLTITILCAGLTSAQENIPQEQLEKVAPRLAQYADKEQQPFQTDVDVSKAFGMKIKDYGAVVLPSKSLTKEALNPAGEEVVPIGQLWLLRLVPVADGKKLPADKLCPVQIKIEQNENTFQLLFLGARKKSGGSLELLVYGKGSEPLVTLPLKKAERRQDGALELQMRKGSTSFGIVDVRLAGALEASLTVDEFFP